MRMRPPQTRKPSLGIALVLPLLSACIDAPTAPHLPLPAEVRMAPVAEASFGGGQTARPGEAVAVAPSVVVRDENGLPMGGVSVRFAVSMGGGAVEQPVALTDAQGMASAGDWTLGAEPGENELEAVVGMLPGIRFKATAVAPAFQISIRYLGTMPLPRHEQAVSRAVRRWESIVSADLADHPIRSPLGACFPAQPALNEVVDDVLIFVELVSLDGSGGYLGEAGPCYLRSNSLLPVMGFLKLDVDDLNQMETTDVLDDLVLHEVGHILGVGTLWPAKQLLNGMGTSDPRVTGAHALQAYRELGGIEADVPAENSGGPLTRDVHWRESVFANELMTGYINIGSNPLSTLTIATLQDLGYGTQSAAAGTYSLVGGPQTQGRMALHEREQVIFPRFVIDTQGRSDIISH